MSWFAKSVVEVEPGPAETDERRFQKVDEGYRAAEREFNLAHRALFTYVRQNPDSRSVLLNGDLFCRVNAMNADPARSKLEAAQAQALARRNELLAERAQLMKDLGRIR